MIQPHEFSASRLLNKQLVEVPIHEINSLEEICEFHDLSHLPNNSLFAISNNKLFNQLNHITLGLQYQFKMLGDRLLALVMLAAFSPFLLLMSILIYSRDKHSPFYITERIGENNKPFKMYKFRSMRPGSDIILVQSGNAIQHQKNDQRITRLGRIIRALSIDEIPQLFNVLKGDMSFVGPRPFVPAEFELVNRMGMRGTVKPGLSGMWQVTGRVVNARSACDVEAIDNFYIEHWNLWLDLKIFVKTIPVVLFCRGA